MMGDEEKIPNLFDLPTVNYIHNIRDGDAGFCDICWQYLWKLRDIYEAQIMVVEHKDNRYHDIQFF